MPGQPTARTRRARRPETLLAVASGARALALVLALAIGAPLLLPTAVAATGATILFEPSDRQADLRVGEKETFVFPVRNIHPTNTAFVEASVSVPPGWSADVAPRNVRLAPDKEGTATNATADIIVTITAASPRYERGVGTVRFSVTSADGAFDEAKSIALAPAAPYVLGAFTNPLPAPLDGPWGVFLLDLAAFAVIGGLLIAVQEPLLRRIAAHSHRPIMDLAIRKLRVPVMVLATFAGLSYAVGVLPPSTAIDNTVRLLDIGIYVLSLYLVYKLFESILTYYGLKIASKTETKIDDVLIPLARKVAIVVVIVAGIIMTFRRLEVDLTVFIAGGVVASMVLAFAAQETLSNFFSGLHLMIDRPFTEGELIQLETGEICRVEHIGLRSTRLYHTRRHEQIIMPNNKLSSNRVTNLASPDRKYRMDIEVGVAYGSDPEKVKAILLGIAGAHPNVVQEVGWSQPQVYFTAFADSAMSFILRITLDDLDGRWRVPSEVREAIVREFAAAGIQIPFPQRDLWLRNAAPEATLAVGQSAEGRIGTREPGRKP